MKHLGTITLETERLLLRRYVPDDAEDAFNNWTNSETVTKYLIWPPHGTLDVTRGYLASDPMLSIRHHYLSIYCLSWQFTFGITKGMYFY